MLWLKQSTAVVVSFGPFLDKTDGVTLKADATTIADIDHATTGIFLSKNGGNAAIRHQNVTASVADDYGMMRVTLDATDTNTLGTLRMSFAKAATYLPVWQDFMVVPANVWDSMFGADYLQVDATQIAGAAVNTESAQIGANVVTQANIDFGAKQKSSIGTAVNDQLTAANTELTAIPAVTAGLRSMVQFIFESLKLKFTENKDTGVGTLFKDDGSTPLGTRTDTDDGTTVTRGAMT